MEGEHVFVNHHGRLLFQLPNPSKTTYSYPSNWVYDDDIDMDTDEDNSAPQEWHAGGGEGGAGCSGSIPPEDMIEHPMTQSCIAAGSLGFNKAHFYQYLVDKLSHFNLRLNTIDEHQQQHAQAQQEML